MQHVVSRPAAPFLARNDTLEVHQLPLLQDNLGWIVVCVATGDCAVVDGPMAAPVLDYIAQRGWRLTTVLNTHHHWDHIGINKELRKLGKLDGLQIVGSALHRDQIPGLTRAVGEGDTVTVGAAVGVVLLTEGHVDGHISFLFGDALFCGDTMFGAGCGYLFDGPPEKMWRSLAKLSALPEHTKVCCAHEYTEDNLRFALTVEPNNEALVQRVADAKTLRGQGGCTIPTTIGLERATNPFVRAASKELRANVAEQMGVSVDAPDAEIFAATRALKDTKRYKQ